MAKIRNTNLAEGRRDKGTTKSSINLEEGIESTEAQPDRGKKDLLEVDQSGLKGKELQGSNRKDDVLNKQVESNQMQPIDITNYEHVDTRDNIKECHEPAKLSSNSQVNGFGK
ncbi:hypothetical protein RND71_008316 [Anisodus tanguticus]|uniref:Uncharacterized protein n=1 Tax=Anisodus tanguticus TaxID=243964 RepID=A0AAE1SPC7_9SOLA|nr:hypothetical protein RND71_008316 [Anisodus tanguticus]